MTTAQQSAAAAATTTATIITVAPPPSAAAAAIAAYGSNAGLCRCNNCKSQEAEIFQVDGDFCLECWQTITHTNI